MDGDGSLAVTLVGSLFYLGIRIDSLGRGSTPGLMAFPVASMG
ncbi:MAG: hypothetical protein ACRDK3_16210 [Actinomycetota bacterium]